MSVQLRPLSSKPDDEEAEQISVSNGEWLGLVRLAESMGEPVHWNGCHDTVTYTPEQLEAIARRVEQVRDAPEWLRYLARQGGAELS